MKNAAYLTFKMWTVCWVAAVLFSCKKQIEVKNPAQLENQTEVENPALLKDQIMQELANRFNPKDTLFVETTRILGVCGNDERYDGVTSPAERQQKIEYIREHPYFVDIKKDYRETYKFGNKILVTGEVFDEQFSSKNLNFDNAKLAKKKTIVDLQYLEIKKDTVKVQAFDFHNSEKTGVEMTFVLKNSRWKVL